MKTNIRRCLHLLITLVLPFVAQAQFSTTFNGVGYTITGYAGPGGDLTIPDTLSGGYPVISIGYNAFGYCSTLTSITISTNVTSIGTNAFYSCSNLSSAVIPNSVTNIGPSAFYGCSNLTSIAIPASVTKIGFQAFTGCSSMTAIAVDSQNPVYSSLDGILFNKSQTTLILFPGGLGGNYSIPDSVTNIGTSAFSGCSSLDSVIITNGVTSIVPQEFSYCTKLASATIGANITNLGSQAFLGCTSLTAIAVDSQNPVYSSLNGVLFDKSQRTLILIPGGLSGSYSIPNSVTSIGNHAANEPSSLSSVIIPGSVTNIAISGFSGCSSMTNIAVDSQNTVYSSLNGVLFDRSQTTLIEFPRGLGGSYSIPNSVTSIGSSACKDCSNLISVTIPGSVTNIGSFAFFGNEAGLKGVYFKGNAPVAGSFIFNNSYDTTVYYLPGTTGWGSTYGGPASLPTVLWNPEAQTGSATFGVISNQFGFTISGSSNLVIVVEGSPDLVNWMPISTNTLNTFIGTNGTSYFSDSQWTNTPGRFYRFRSP